jgi:hypothetical protein
METKERIAALVWAVLSSEIGWGLIVAFIGWALCTFWATVLDPWMPHSDEQWSAAFEKNRRLAATFSFLKTVGINFPGAYRSVRAFFTEWLPAFLASVRAPKNASDARKLFDQGVAKGREEVLAGATVVEAPKPGEASTVIITPPSDGDTGR